MKLKNHRKGFKNCIPILLNNLFIPDIAKKIISISTKKGARDSIIDLKKALCHLFYIKISYYLLLVTYLYKQKNGSKKNKFILSFSV